MIVIYVNVMFSLTQAFAMLVLIEKGSLYVFKRCPPILRPF